MMPRPSPTPRGLLLSILWSFLHIFPWATAKSVNEGSSCSALRALPQKLLRDSPRQVGRTRARRGSTPPRIAVHTCLLPLDSVSDLFMSDCFKKVILHDRLQLICVLKDPYSRTMCLSGGCGIAGAAKLHGVRLNCLPVVCDRLLALSRVAISARGTAVDLRCEGPVQPHDVSQGAIGGMREGGENFNIFANFRLQYAQWTVILLFRQT